MPKVTSEQTLALGLFAGVASRVSEAAANVMINMNESKNENFIAAKMELTEVAAGLLVTINEMIQSGLLDEENVNGAYAIELVRLLGREVKEKK